jgi:DNA invertase Pin-like site-specific DNA recombinase
MGRNVATPATISATVPRDEFPLANATKHGVALYARVSTAGCGQDPEMQLRELREYVHRRGWEIVGDYVDVGISGSKDYRPELNRLMADAHKRRT